MEMRKFIIEIHPDGKLTWCEYEDPKDGKLTRCEYEDPKDAIRAAEDRAWMAGYRQALVHCNDPSTHP